MADDVNVRPIFRDELLDNYSGSAAAQFDVEDIRLPLLNGIRREGTPLDAGQMNNLFCFDNLIAMAGTQYAAVGYKRGSKSCAETIKDDTADETTGEYRVIATRESRQVSKGIWTVRELLYDLDETGVNKIVQERRMTITGNTQGEYSAEVETQ